MTAYQNYPADFDKPIFQGEYGEYGYMKGVVQEYSNVDNTMIIEWDVHPNYGTGSFSKIKWTDTPDPPTNDPISFTTYENKLNINDAKTTIIEDTYGSMVLKLYAGESTPE